MRMSAKEKAVSLKTSLARFILLVALFAAGFQGRAAGDPFAGYWSLYLPDGRAGWLHVSGTGDGLKAEALWGIASVVPLDSAKLLDGKLVLTHRRKTERKNAEGKPIYVTETLTATMDGDNLYFVSVTPQPEGGAVRVEFSGHRQPPLPPAPDLNRVRFGPPIQLFNGTNLDGWRLVETNAANGWRAQDGLLINDVTLPPGSPPRDFGNLRTVAEFEDFSLHAETRVPPHGNSGIFLRGTDEVQVYDSYGRPNDSHNMGALYSRIQPRVSAEKPAGQWQTLDIIYVDRHVSVTLNGTPIIDNQPVLGPTGGALWPEMDRPGPIYLQGDEDTGIAYRNLILRPVLKN